MLLGELVQNERAQLEDYLATLIICISVFPLARGSRWYTIFIIIVREKGFSIDKRTVEHKTGAKLGMFSRPRGKAGLGDE